MPPWETSRPWSVDPVSGQHISKTVTTKIRFSIYIVEVSYTIYFSHPYQCIWRGYAWSFTHMFAFSVVDKKQLRARCLLLLDKPMPQG